ncbi:hypothetical protein KP509_12G026200 [Ceratopteris richardii]|uniref:Uncharacterized protein n=1 Tax=Ceratopteris richardii TaxID=49495 RepID=A0A8T2TJV6_CERRI|nr:hypothetical protein KP509_12G026200 [Ceratopteris richardii]
MNIFARRAAASEGAFFSQASKESIVRLREKTPRSSAPAAGDASSTGDVALLKDEVNPDVLPEILQHSLPKHQQYDPLPTSSSPSPSSLVSLASAKPSNVASRHRADNNGLAFLPTLPQASFGPRRWKVTEEEVKLMASTANEARFLDDTPTMDDAKAKALVEGYGVILKAFAVATALVIGGATVATTALMSKLQIHSTDDIRVKGSEHMQPRAEAIRSLFEPWRQWVQERLKNPDVKKSQRRAIGTPFAQQMGLKQLANEVEEK